MRIYKTLIPTTLYQTDTVVHVHVAQLDKCKISKHNHIKRYNDQRHGHSQSQNFRDDLYLLHKHYFPRVNIFTISLPFQKKQVLVLFNVYFYFISKPTSTDKI
jgi:hypothetical protein